MLAALGVLILVQALAGAEVIATEISCRAKALMRSFNLTAATFSAFTAVAVVFGGKDLGVRLAVGVPVAVALWLAIATARLLESRGAKATVQVVCGLWPILVVSLSWMLSATDSSGAMRWLIVGQLVALTVGLWMLQAALKTSSDDPVPDLCLTVLIASASSGFVCFYEAMMP